MRLCYKVEIPLESRKPVKCADEAGDLVYASDSRPNRRWTVAMVSKYHYSLVYEVEVEKEKQMVAIPQPAETNIFIDFWSPNLYPVIHTDR